jgi:hypothetical protein
MERRGQGSWILFGFSRYSLSSQCAPQHVLNNSLLYPISFALNIILCNGYLTNPKEGITIHIIYIYIQIYLKKCLNYFCDGHKLDFLLL